MSASGMEKLIRQRWKELDDLQAEWRFQDNPVETLDYLLMDTIDQAAQMGSEIYMTAPDRNRLTVTAREGIDADSAGNNQARTKLTTARRSLLDARS